MLNKARIVYLLKLMSPFILISALLYTALILSAYFYGSHMLNEQLRARILDESQFLEYEYREDGLVELLEEIEERIEKNRLAWRFLYAVQSPKGEWVFDKLSSRPPIGWSTLHQFNYAPHVLVYTTELESGYRFSVGLDKGDLIAFQTTFIKNAVWLAGLGIAASLMVGALGYRDFSRLLRNIAIPIQRFSDGHFQTRIRSLSGGPDMTHLANNINAMFSQIEELIAQQRRLSASLAHDLRTPLTRVKNNLVALTPQVSPTAQIKLGQIERDLEQILRLFTDILQLNEIQSGGLKAHFKVVDLSALVTECFDLYHPLLQDSHIETLIKLAHNVNVTGSPTLLKQVLINIIENTLSHSGGQCKMTVKLEVSRDSITLVVQDNGRLQRNSSPNKHFGLGEKFIRAIIELHGGTSHSGPRNPGYSTTITLPLTRSESSGK